MIDQRKRRGRGRRSTGDEIHVAGDDALVVAGVVVLAGLRRQASSMAAVMEEEEVPGLGGGYQIRHGAADVSSGRRGEALVGVDEDGDVLLGEAESLHQAPAHPRHVVDASPQLRLRAGVVAAHQQRLLRHLLPHRNVDGDGRGAGGSDGDGRR